MFLQSEKPPGMRMIDRSDGGLLSSTLVSPVLKTLGKSDDTDWISYRETTCARKVLELRDGNRALGTYVGSVKCKLDFLLWRCSATTMLGYNVRDVEPLLAQIVVAVLSFGTVYTEHSCNHILLDQMISREGMHLYFSLEYVR
ncbi:hypothetical protein L1987_43030 [Smallanthus sonchifolius]|uniref:Uncharacterized protein n=1 Tax=Smallanthus sonchifolius TaxID=185202 RepID=A0ACB9GJY4_9ASTR|nr:hypothetical protein L1987_43030 [Smallanthus sonchifolius]